MADARNKPQLRTDADPAAAVGSSGAQPRAAPSAVGCSDLDGSGLVVAVVRSLWNRDISERLASGAGRALVSVGTAPAFEVTVPGAFELPMACRIVAERGDVHAVVAVGAVIRGETTHYELVSESAARGLMSVQLRSGVPIGFGVVATENEHQALARSQGPGGHNVGADAALAAVALACLQRAGAELGSGPADRAACGSEWLR